MTSFPRAPRVLKGALITVNLPDPTPTVIAFQINPSSLSRSLQAQTFGGEGDRRSGPVRYSGAPVETINLEVKLDATDQLEKGDPIAIELGLHPQLAALETLIYPASATVLTNIALTNLGVIEIVPAVAPFTLLVYGPQRILPVQVTSFSVTEEAHDVMLNPILATVQLGLQVLSYNDLSPDDPGHAIFLAHQVAKEAMARRATVNSLERVVGGNVRLF
jgi:hypothetical protein